MTLETAEERWKHDILARELEAEAIEYYPLADGKYRLRILSPDTGKWYEYVGTGYEPFNAAYADNANRRKSGENNG